MNLIRSIVHSLPAFIGVYWSKKLDEKEVPKIIKNVIKRKYGNHINADWSIRSGKFLARFHLNGVKTYIIFNPFGCKIKTLTELNFELLPQMIQYIIHRKYSGFSLIRNLQVESVRKTQFEIEVRKNHDYKYILFDQQGMFLEERSKGNLG